MVKVKIRDLVWVLVMIRVGANYNFWVSDMVRLYVSIKI